MKEFRLVAIYLAVGLLAASFIGWRFEYQLPFFPNHYYALGGLVLVAAVIWGRVVGPWLMAASLLPIGYVLIALVLSKTATWSSLNGTECLIISVIGFVVGLVLSLVGSEEIADRIEAEAAHASRDIVCAKCGQYLGKASGFESPCPRCGSNRYTYED